MRCYITVAATCGLTLVAALAGTPRVGASAAPPSASPMVPAAVARVAEDSTLRTVMTRRYRMSGRIRPLLFWIGKDDIGLARIAWRKGDSGALGYEFLVGTDPAKAPRSLNRWGYIAEDTSGTGGSLLALMTGADETSYDEAASNAARAPGGGDFRAIHAHLFDGTSTWQTARVATPSVLTVHDVDATLGRVREETDAATRRDMRVPTGARTGFLTAVAELIDSTVRGVNQKQDTRALVRQRVKYVFGQGAYELSLREVETSRDERAGGSVPVVRTAFEIRTLATDVRTRFEVTSGLEGALCGVPVAIAWQPRWWLRVGLRLED